ncbi:hypothetical protein C2E23DRAFT_801614 [Lenzites betulinus]|nr:hypothetical protein C2E23DRAFT_801614 [Lenzites betulinus]
MCCIDKSSSAEVSEAIASMFYWYSAADVCYVYLKDVPPAVQPLRPPEIAFLSSKWFKRCWTLQELIAPRSVVFLSQDWKTFGTKTTLASHITSVTGIPKDVLLGEQSLQSVSVAQRMSWAANRRATRIEDTAYCLMGLFAVRINIMYGEGTYAFVRLQEEILKHIHDPSLLIWGTSCDDFSDLGLALLPDTPPTSPAPSRDLRSLNVQLPPSPAPAHRYLLATSPDDFEGAGRGDKLFVPPNERLVAGPFPFRTVPCHMLHMRVPLIPMCSIGESVGLTSPTAYLALLGCKTRGGKSLALLVSQQQKPQGDGLWFIGNQTATSSLVDVRNPAPAVRIVRLSPKDIPSSMRTVTLDVYGPLSAPRSFRDPTHSQALYRELAENEGSFKITLSGWCAPALAANGYYLVRPPSTEPHVYRLTLPQDYETCPHASEDPACPFASTGAQCPLASTVLKIAIANCSSCRQFQANHRTRFLRGDVSVDVLDSPDSPQSAPGRAGCSKGHVGSWDLRDGIALKTFTFPIRGIQDGHPPSDVRAQILLVTLSLKRMLSELREDTHARSLVLEIGACTQASLTTPVSSPIRDSSGFDTRFLTPTTASPTNDSSGRLHPGSIARTRSNSLVNPSTTGYNAAQSGLRASDIDRTRSRSINVMGPSITPSLLPPVPIFVAPAPNPPAKPTPAPPARAPSPPPATPEPPAATTPVLHNTGPKDHLEQPVDGPSTTSPRRTSLEQRPSTVRAQDERGRAERKDPALVRLRKRVKEIATERVQRVISRLGRSRRRAS